MRERSFLSTRREFLRGAGLGAVGLTFAGWHLPIRALAAATPGGARNRPNIVYILADDLGYGDLGCFNNESKIPTPNLDALARQGMRFTDAHSPSAVCTPTRYSLLTGRYNWRSRLQQGVLKPWDPPLIEEGRLTVPEFLRRNGYRTACIGKWHLGINWPLKDPSGKRDGSNVDFTQPIKNGPTSVGFDHFFGMTGSGNYPPFCFVENDRTVGLPTEMKPKEMFGTPGPMLPGWTHEQVMPELTRHAVGYIEEHGKRHAGQPFFMYFALTAPHTPIAPAKEFVGRSQAGQIGDFTAELDWTVGEVMAALARAGLDQNTMVVFTSDNGSPALANNARDDVRKKFGHKSNGDWRGVKTEAWDGGHRVPYLVRWPGVVAADSTCKQTICLTDLMATTAAMLGQHLPEDAGEDSYSLLPLLHGEAGDKPIREATVHHSYRGMFAIRQGPWKLVAGQGGGGGRESDERDSSAPGQLYNLADDPAEQRNLYNEMPEVVKPLMELLERYKREPRTAPRV